MPARQESCANRAHRHDTGLSRRVAILFLGIVTVLLAAMVLVYTGWRLNRTKSELAAERLTIETTLNELRATNSALDTASKQAYRNAISLARRMLENQNGSGATEQLDEVSTQWRNWEWGYLRHRLTSARHVLEAGGAVWDVEFNRSSDRVVATTANATAIVWDVQSGEIISRLEGHHNRVDQAWFTFDGTQVITASLDGTARAWDVETGLCLRTVPADPAIIFESRAFQKSARYLTHSRSEVFIWENGGSEPTHRIVPVNGFVSSAELSPDGSQILVFVSDTQFRVYDAANGAHKHTVPGKRAAYAKDETQLCVLDQGRVDIWNTETWQLLAQLIPPNSLLSPGDVPFETLGVTSDGNTVIIGAVEVWFGWDIARLEPNFQTKIARSAPLSSTGPFSVTTSDGALTLEYTDGATISCSNAATGERLYTIENVPANVDGEFCLLTCRCSPDERRLIVVRPHELECRDVKSGESIWRHPRQEQANLVYRFSEDSKFVLGFERHEYQRLVLDAESGEVLFAWDNARNSSVSKSAMDPCYEPRAGSAFVYSGDRSRAAGLVGGDVVVRNATNAVVSFTLSKLDAPFLSVAWNPKGTLLVTVDGSGDLELWDAATGERTAPMPRLESEFYSPASARFTADGEGVLAQGSMHAVTGTGPAPDILWDVRETKDSTIVAVQSGLVQFNYEMENSLPLKSLRLVCGLDPFGIERANRNFEYQFLRAQDNDELALGRAARPDGKHVVKASKNGALVVQGVQDERIVDALFGPEKALHAIAWSPNGRYIAAGAGDGTIWIWDVLPRAQFFDLWSPESTGIRVVHDRVGQDITEHAFRATHRDLQRVGHLEALRELPKVVHLTAAAMSPNSNVLAVGGEDGSVSVWDLATGDRMHRFTDHEPSVTEIEFDGSGSSITSKDTSQNTFTRRLDSGTLISQSPASTVETQAVSTENLSKLTVASPDNTREFTIDADGTLSVRDTKDNAEVLTVTLPRGPLAAFFRSADGTRLTIVYRDFTARVIKALPWATDTPPALK